MLYRVRREIDLRRFSRKIAGILETKPLCVANAPLAVVSMVANRDVPMYVAAIKSFYPKLGGGKIVAIVDRDMPSALRDTLRHHIDGIELAILEDIPAGTCQRGGTWERLLFCLDRSECEYTIQLDADTLCVSEEVNEVVACVRANRAFTMADGFTRQPLLEAAAMAEATPSDYIGIVAERAFARYPGHEQLYYIRGSSGFAGFAKGGFTRTQMDSFHQEMEKLVGEKRWREWGSEQCGSNWAVANSPDPIVLPYPEYGSFNGRVLRHRAKLFHFIGRYRFQEDYFARRTQELIAALTPGAPPMAPPGDDTGAAQRAGSLPLAFTRSLTLPSLVPFLAWKLGGFGTDVQVQLRGERVFRDDRPPGPKLVLRRRASNGDYGVAYEIFVDRLLFPPVWIPPERVKLIVDLGANVGMSCLWWLSNYWRARVLAFEPHPEHARQAQSNIVRNGFAGRFELHEAAVGGSVRRAVLSNAGSSSSLNEPGRDGFEVEVVDLFTVLRSQHVDILKIDIEGSEEALLGDPRFRGLSVGALVMEWHARSNDRESGREWSIRRLQELGYRTYVTQDLDRHGIIWGYRDPPWGSFVAPSCQAVEEAERRVLVQDLVA